MSYQGLHNSLASRALSYGAILILSAAGALAQTQTAPPPPDSAPHPWRTAAPDVSEAAPQPLDQEQTQAQAQPQANPAPAPPNYSSFPTFPGAPQASQLPNPNMPLPGSAQQPQPYYGQGGQPAYGQSGYGQSAYGQQSTAPQAAPMAQKPVPAQLTLKPGATVTVRLSQALSSEHNQTGDTFYATLAAPLIVDGVVVAQRGETVTGRVTEAQKAGRVEGTSKLGVELVSLKLADGNPVTVQTQMIGHSGGTTYGNDVGLVAGTTALGAAVGAGAAGGVGAAMGAGAGAGLGLIGTLFTKGRPTVLYPETQLTFSIKAPVEIATDRAPQAFHYASARDYGTSGAPGYAQRPPAGPAPAYGYAPGYYGPAYYPYPYYWGPSVYVGGYYRGFRRW